MQHVCIFACCIILANLTTVMFILQASEALTQHLQVFIHNLQEMQSNQHIYSLLVFQDSDVHRLYGS